MYSDTITLFNRYHSDVTDMDMWYPHVLYGVNLIVDSASITAKYGIETKDKASLHVKYDGDCIIQGLQYLPAKEWYKLTNDELKDYITFNADADRFDFFIVGDYGSEEPIADESGLFYQNMEKQTECYAVTSVSSPYKVIPHFEIMAR